MQIAPLPTNERERLISLYALNILDTPPEERYDRITRLAKRVLDMPIVLISLVDRQRQWFKSSQGLDTPETGRDVSFCAHTIHEFKALIVADASVDERFSDNPLVAGAPYIRFYAGHPIAGPLMDSWSALCV